MMKWITLVLVLGVSTARADKPKTNVEFTEEKTAVHPHLKSYTMSVVENGKASGKEVLTMTGDGRLAKREHFRDGKVFETIEYTWDANGNLTKHVAKDDQVSTTEWKYTLDKQGRVASADEVGSRGTQTIMYTWDAKGGHEEKMLGTRNNKPVVLNTTTFDAAGRKLKACTSTAMITSEQPVKNVCKTTEYDKHGNTKRVVTDGKTTTFTNTYDKQNRLIKSVASGKDGSVVTQTWNDNGDIATYTTTSPDWKMVVTYSYQPK